MIERILKGVLTSELTFLWLGSYPTTIKDSICSFLVSRSLMRAENVVFLTYFPQNKGW